MRLISIDPGNTYSAYVVLEDGAPVHFAKLENEKFIEALRCGDCGLFGDHMAIEMIESFGMAVGKEVFQTCVWLGRFIEVRCFRGSGWTAVTRKEVKLHLCGSMRAKDPNIRQAIIDKFGGKDAAIGKKRSPGPLYGISADVWSALAVGLTYLETKAVLQ